MSHESTIKIRVIALIGLLFGLCITLLSYIASSYFKEAIASDSVGFFYIVPYAIILVVLLNLHKIVAHHGKSRIFLLLFIAQLIVLMSLIFLPVSIMGAALLMAYYGIYGIVYVMLDIVLESYSSDEASGRIRGLYGSAMGVGVLIGPLLSTNLLDRYGFTGVFITLLIAYAMMFVLSMISFANIQTKIVDAKSNLSEVIKSALKRRRIRRIYLIAISLTFTFATSSIFLPLYLLEQGLTWPELGVLFTVMLLPHIFVGYPAGYLADKKWGEKEMLIVGMIIVISGFVTIYLTQSASIGLWMVILVTTRIGAVLVESMRETYFYKHVDGDNVSMINVFRTSRSIAYILASFFSFLVLTVFHADLHFVFLVAAGVMLLALYPAATLRDTVPTKE